MKRKKLNILAWYALGLTAVLVTVSLVLATGMTWARYRTDSSADLFFNTRSPMMVCLGKLEYILTTEGEEIKFVQTNGGEWTRGKDGQLQLDFAVANGVSTKEKEFEERDQQVYVRVASTRGLQINQETIALKLMIPKPEDPEKEQTEATTAPTTEPLAENPTEEPQEDLENFDIYEAQAVYITKGSPMYTTFGEGWVFHFMDEEGEELHWTLEGGELSYIEMHLTMESSIPLDTSLLQLQIDSKYIPE